MAVTEDSTPVQALSVSGPVLSLGPTRLLKNSVTNLMERLDLSSSRNTGYRGVMFVFIAEILLICGAAGRLVSLYLSGQLDKMEDLPTVIWDLVMSEKEFVEIDTRMVKTIHMITATLVHMLMVPQLYILVVSANEKLTLVLQMVLALLMMMLTLTTQTLQTVLKKNTSGGAECQERGTCLHSYMAWMLFVNIVAFLSIIFIRVLFNMRLRSWIVGIKIVGPVIEFLVSRKSKDFQALILIITLIVTVLSGIILNTKQLYANDMPEEVKSKTVELLVDLGSALMCLAGLLVLVLIYFHSHTMFSHTNLVSEHDLEQELASLGERHKQVLAKDRLTSKTKYCPETCDPARPVRSGQQLGRE